MKAISRFIAPVLGAGVFMTMFVPHAAAGCGPGNLQGPFTFVTPVTDARTFTPAAVPSASAEMQQPSLVGMWSVQLVSQGNATSAMPIPDGALVDFGYQIFHIDNTEWENSGGRSPNTQNFCEGVWGKTGFNTYELNHFAYQYDSISGSLTGTANIRYQMTLSPSGNSFTGTFTIDVYDTKASHLAHLAGTLSATRVTVDTVVTAIP
jgi:hypothetical protein